MGLLQVFYLRFQPGVDRSRPPAGTALAIVFSARRRHDVDNGKSVLACCALCSEARRKEKRSSGSPSNLHGMFFALNNGMAKNRKRDIDAQPSGETTAPHAADETTAAAFDRERIAARAYELYQRRGGEDGDAMEDWLAAEREFSNRSRTDE
jgi:hypothetical protein